MPKINIADLRWDDSSKYPEPLASRLKRRHAKQLADAGKLNHLEVNLTRLAPGAQSTMRHWHEVEDEFIFLLDGDLVLIDDNGETHLTSGDAAGFPAGINNAHHLVNRSTAPAFFLEISQKCDKDKITYPDEGLNSIRRQGVLSFE